jgi:drug/metabolite transporter (DMT)-like permease
VLRDEATAVAASSEQEAAQARRSGLLLGALGVLLFSVSLPATRAAVSGGIDPYFVGFGRAAVAGVLALAWLLLNRAPRPHRVLWRSIALCALVTVIGFPVMTSLALETGTAVHAVVVIGLLPAGTAVWAVLRAGERPSAAFWLAAGAGLLIVLAFAAVREGTGIGGGDALLLVSVVLCSLGYAEGAVLARELGGPATICWTLVLALPVSVAATVFVLAIDGAQNADRGAWLGFAYAALVAMFLGYFAWYAGLARGGVARISQVQLLMPLLSLGWAALLLGETVGAAEAVAALAIIACVAVTQRARVDVAGAGGALSAGARGAGPARRRPTLDACSRRAKS